MQIACAIIVKEKTICTYPTMHLDRAKMIDSVAKMLRNWLIVLKVSNDPPIQDTLGAIRKSSIMHKVSVLYQSKTLGWPYHPIVISVCLFCPMFVNIMVHRIRFWKPGNWEDYICLRCCRFKNIQLDNVFVYFLPIWLHILNC